MSPVEPLRIPPPETGWRRFFVPSWKQIHRAIREQLERRDASALEEWPLDKRETGLLIGRAAADAVRWPNPYFVPSDRFELLGWDDSDQMTVWELALEIEERVIGRRIGRGFWKDLIERDATVAEVIDELRAAAERGDGRPVRPGRLVTWLAWIFRRNR